MLLYRMGSASSRSGTETGRERDGNGTENGTGTGRKTGRERDGNGTGTGRERDGNGKRDGNGRDVNKTVRMGFKTPQVCMSALELNHWIVPIMICLRMSYAPFNKDEGSNILTMLHSLLQMPSHRTITYTALRDRERHGLSENT